MKVCKIVISVILLLSSACSTPRTLNNEIPKMPELVFNMDALDETTNYNESDFYINPDLDLPVEAQVYLNMELQKMTSEQHERLKKELQDKNGNGHKTDEQLKDVELPPIYLKNFEI